MRFNGSFSTEIWVLSVANGLKVKKIQTKASYAIKGGDWWLQMYLLDSLGHTIIRKLIPMLISHMKNLKMKKRRSITENQFQTPKTKKMKKIGREKAYHPWSIRHQKKCKLDELWDSNQSEPEPPPANSRACSNYQPTNFLYPNKKKKAAKSRTLFSPYPNYETERNWNSKINWFS